jgi:hypothetical protein
MGRCQFSQCDILYICMASYIKISPVDSGQQTKSNGHLEMMEEYYRKSKNQM